MKKTLALLLCLGLVLGLFPVGTLMPVANAAAVPSVSVTLPPQTMIGEGMTFAVSFQNGGTTGYGPFIDLVLPGGANGLAFTSATYLGVPVTATVLTFPMMTGWVLAQPDTSCTRMRSMPLVSPWWSMALPGTSSWFCSCPLVPIRQASRLPS